MVKGRGTKLGKERVVVELSEEGAERGGRGMGGSEPSRVAAAAAAIAAAGKEGGVGTWEGEGEEGGEQP